MKVLILAGGFGSRLGDETELKPKPMLEIGSEPILWHIMKLYSHHGFNDFVVLLGYKGYVIKEYFANFFLHQCDCTIDLSNNSVEILKSGAENWKVTLVNTGLNTMTGGRIKQVQRYVGHEPFMLTYGDGVSDVDITALVGFHRSHGKAVTLTSVQPHGRFGTLKLNGKEGKERVASFQEKPADGGWINGGFFVCEPRVFDYISDAPSTVFEHGPLETLAKQGELFAYKHRGYWQCMDTPRDRAELLKHWQSGKAPWKVWSV